MAPSTLVAACLPVRWKQFLVPWSALYPLTSMLLMVHVIMPHYTWLARRRLFR